MGCLTDHYSRRINYLRVSVTDRCNLRCVYCMPPEGVVCTTHQAILRYEEILKVVEAAVGLGISRLRITGGEPLARLGLVDFVRMVGALPGLEDIALTTNGTLLAPVARALREAGLRRVNISLDTLRPERFKDVTRWGRLADALAGIAAASAAGLAPVKINMVVMRGINDDEIVEFARLTRDEGWHVRFIELMPTDGGGANLEENYMSVAEVRARIEELGPLLPAGPPHGAGPARYFALPDANGTIGFISPVSEHFCEQCNRLRLTADGKLRPCLLDSVEVDVREPLRAGASVEDLQRLFVETLRIKPRQHHLAESGGPRDRAMSQIGG